MTTATEKPTPGPSPVWTAETYFVCLRSGEMGWCVKDADDTVCDVYTDDPRWIAELIAEAGTVYHETGLTPRQLAEQRAELLAALSEAERIIPELVRQIPAGVPMPVAIAHERIRALLARCKETTA